MSRTASLRRLTASALTAALLATPLALAMPADTIKIEEYGKSGDWTLRRMIANGNEVVACDMINFSGSELGLRYAYDRAGGSLGFSALASAASEAPMPVEIWFDSRKKDAQTVTMSLEEDGNEYPWRVYYAPNTEPDGMLDDAVLNSAKVSFAYDVQDEGRHIETFALKGYAEASQKTTECINGPNDPGSAGAESAGVEAVAAPKIIKGTCRLVVDGKTYVDIKKSCPIWMANDGTGTFWINTDRETYLGDYFAEVTPAGNGRASGHWNGEKGATHAQSFLGEDFRQTKGGCWANKRATICAAK